MSRRPKVGDMIFYELKTDPDGKLRAFKASIEGVIIQKSSQQKRANKNGFLQTIIGIFVLSGIGISSMDFSSSRPSPTTSPAIRTTPSTLSPKPGCNI
jgi:hypothetical protein